MESKETELKKLKKLEMYYINELEDETENLKHLLTTTCIEDINLYQIYLKITELINNKSIVKQKIENIILMEV